MGSPQIAHNLIPFLLDHLVSALFWSELRRLSHGSNSAPLGRGYVENAVKLAYLNLSWKPDRINPIALQSTLDKGQTWED